MACATQEPEKVEQITRRLSGKLDHHRDLIESYEAVGCEDADIVVCAIGISARAARRAVNTARASGVKAGLFRPVTLWPFPEAALRAATATAKSVIVAEMNAGQLVLEVERCAGGQCAVLPVSHGGGSVHDPAVIAEVIVKAAAAAA